ncbi:DNA repair protein XRCC1 isoform X2 [Megalops cyprinoides]|uniref:DNA repair protein XRCC1 isoform X2 n=1 Tax=Megalops cyprinoides TaxID=118141 RepID=UPI001863B5B3|nr:DNA repair protein XRCC1 isoform X2 [Megalops cyprinoides]
MAPVKIKHVVSFTSQDPKHCVENLCAVECTKPWLCSPQDRSGVLKAELQMERATQIGYIDVGNCGSAFIQVDVGRSSWSVDQPYVTLLPTATLMSPAESREGRGQTGVRMFKRSDFLSTRADELWDRVRVTCSQPFNRRAQFGLSFLRIRSPTEDGEGGGELQGEGSDSQLLPEQQTSKVREWLSSPAVQKTFFGRGAREDSPEVTQKGGAFKGCRGSGAGLSRTALMVITAAQSGGKADITMEPGKKKTSRQMKRKPDSKIRPQAHSATSWKRVKPSACEQSPIISPPCSSTDYSASGDPETCCPLCGGNFSSDYLPLHASSCEGNESDTSLGVVELSFTPPPAPDLASSAEEELVPCPLCSFRYPVSRIQQHASSCGDVEEPEWMWAS